MNKLDGLSLDIEQTERDKLRAVFPQCFVEGKLDIDKLLTMCGEYITNDFEKYKFEWKGKSDCLQIAQRRSTATLRPKPDESVNFDSTNNIYIKGDNLEVLKLLQKAYYRQVKMIYIDPPYNTGNDFVYEDDFSDPIAKYREVTSQATKSNPETMGRFHTAWLNMMYPRLRLAANLLRDDGVCFISIDDGEQANLRKICDEVFGEENFVANIIWQKKYSPSNDHKTICPLHDFIIVYRKSEAWQRNLLPRTEENNAQYKHEDERGIFRASDYTCNKTSQERPNLYYPIIHPKTGKEVWPKPSRVWAYSPEAHEENIKNGLVFWGRDGNSNTPSYKRYLDALHGGGGVVPTTWWTFDFAGHNDEAAKETNELLENRIFNTPKPIKLIKQLMGISTNPNDSDIILDFFSGSATTAHAVMQLNAEDKGNRQFIMVQLPELCDEKSEAYKAGYKNICEIGMERIRRSGTKIQSAQSGQMELGAEEKPSLDVGFKVFELDTSNFKPWDGTPVEDHENGQQEFFERLNAMIDNVKKDRSDLDMVYEVMLKHGVPLTYSVAPLDINGKTAYSIGEDCMLLVCFADCITAEDIEAMCEYAPGRIIMGHMCMEDSNTMANAYYILQNRDIAIELV